MGMERLQTAAAPTTDVMSKLAVTLATTENASRLNEYNETEYDFSGFFGDIPWLPISLMIVILVFGVVANLSIIYIVLKNSRLRSTPNIIVVNLTVGDLLCLIFNLPFVIDYHINPIKGWIFGTFMCKLAQSSMVASGCVTVFSLMALAIERYLAIAWPWRNRDSNSCVRLSRSCILNPSWQIVLLIWFGAFIVGAPLWKTSRTSMTFLNFTNCIYIRHTTQEAAIYKLFRLFVAYIIPLFIIVIAHSMTAYALLKSIREPVTGATNRVCQGNRQTSRERSRVKLAIVITVLSVMFFVCWILFYVFDIWYEFFYDPVVFESAFIWQLFQWKNIPIYLLSCLNPIMLYVLSTRFREQLFRDCFCCFRRQKFDWSPTETLNSLKSSFLTASTFRTRPGNPSTRRASPSLPSGQDRTLASADELTKL